MVLGVCIFFCCCLQGMAGDVSLAWNPSTSPGVTGYKIYYGASSGSYGTPIPIPNQTTYIVTGLPDGTYYFAVTAFDASGNESGYSNEVTVIISGPAKSCDLNNDSTTNVIDLQSMVNIILGIRSPSDIYDLNADGQINVLDLQILNNVVLGLRSCP
jgi:hypothetical protein